MRAKQQQPPRYRLCCLGGKQGNPKPGMFRPNLKTYEVSTRMVKESHYHPQGATSRSGPKNDHGRNSIAYPP